MDGSLPSDWRAKREDILKRDGFTCGNCGENAIKTGTQLHVHHIVPRSKGGTHKPSNLKTLCERCHKAVHSSNTKAPTAGPTIDYDRLVDTLQQPPEQLENGDWDYINEVAKDLDEYVGGEEGSGAQYFPTPPTGDELSASEYAALYSSQNTSDSQRWEDLSAKWAREL